MAEFDVRGATHADVVLAVGIVGKCKVLACPNPGDAASPVRLHAGDYITSHGQSADYRHIITTDDAEMLGAGAIVEGYHDEDGWRSSVTAVIDADAVLAKVKQLVGERHARQEANRKAKQEAAWQAANTQEALRAEIGLPASVVLPATAKLARVNGDAVIIDGGRIVRGNFRIVGGRIVPA